MLKPPCRRMRIGRDHAVGVEQCGSLEDLSRRVPVQFRQSAKMSITAHEHAETLRGFTALANRDVRLADGDELAEQIEIRQQSFAVFGSRRDRNDFVR